MKREIIVSSKVLGKYLNNELFLISEDEDYIPFKIEKNTLTINGSDESIITHKLKKDDYADNFTQDISYKKLRKLIKVLKTIEEQPIVLSFNDFITIKQIDF